MHFNKNKQYCIHSLVPCWKTELSSTTGVFVSLGEEPPWDPWSLIPWSPHSNTRVGGLPDALSCKCKKKKTTTVFQKLKCPYIIQNVTQNWGCDKFLVISPWMQFHVLNQPVLSHCCIFFPQPHPSPAVFQGQVDCTAPPDARYDLIPNSAG